MRVNHIIFPTADGPLTVPVISVPASAFSDLQPDSQPDSEPED